MAGINNTLYDPLNPSQPLKTGAAAGLVSGIGSVLSNIGGAVSSAFAPKGTTMPPVIPASTPKLTGLQIPGAPQYNLSGYGTQSANTGFIGPVKPIGPPASIASFNNVTTTAPSSPGAYKGVPIKPGTDADIQAQIRAIDAGQTGGGTNTSSISTGTTDSQNIQNQLGTAQTQLSDLQAKQSAMQNLGINDASQLTKDASGNYILNPALNPANPANKNPYTSTSPTYSGLVGGLASTASQPSPQYEAAQKQYLDYQNKIAQLQQDYAKANADIQSRPSGLTEQQGAQGILARQEAGLEAALSGQLAGAQSAAQTATGQQATQQQGLGVAAGLAAPQPANALGVFNPTTGQYEQYGGGQGGGAVQAGTVMGQIQAGQTGAMNQAILGKVTPMAQNLNTLISQENINPTDVTFLNQLNQWGRGTLSDSAIPKFQGQLNDIVSSLSGILGIPSSATSDFRTQMAGAIVNGLQSGKSVADSVNYFVQQAIQANQGYLAGARGATSTGIPAGGSAGQGGISAGGYNFIKDASGNWVAQ